MAVGPLFTEYPGCHGWMPCGVLARGTHNFEALRIGLASIIYE